MEQVMDDIETRPTRLSIVGGRCDGGTVKIKQGWPNDLVIDIQHSYPMVMPIDLMQADERETMQGDERMGAMHVYRPYYSTERKQWVLIDLGPFGQYQPEMTPTPGAVRIAEGRV